MTQQAVTRLLTLLFLLLSFSMLSSCEKLTDNALGVTTQDLDTWAYCWPNPEAPDQQTPEALYAQREKQCSNTWESIEVPLNPPGRNTPTHQQWLWLRVNLPDLQTGDHLYMRGIDEEFAVFDNEKELYRFGDFDTQSRWYEGFPWHMIAVSETHANAPLYFLVHSKYRHIGIFGNVRLGTKAAHLYQMLFTDLDRVVVGGLLIFTGVMVFLLFLRQPVIGYEWLCLFAVTIGIYLIARTEIKQLYWYAPVAVKWIELACLYTAVPSVTFFLSRIFAEDKTLLWSRLIQLQTSVSLIGMFLAACRVISIQETTQPFLWLTLINMVLGLGIILWRFRSFGGSGWFAVSGVGLLCLFTGYDILAALKLVPWVRPVTHWGVLLVLTSLVFLVKQQVDQAYSEKSRAEESDRIKTVFLANFSHEIRTPLNAIIGFSDLLKKNPQPEKVHEYSEIISQSGKSLLGMINAILDLGKIESNRLELEVNTLKLSVLNQQLHQMFSLEARKRKMGWDIRVGEGVPDLMRLDGGKLRQILTNLLGNAFKFTEKGEVVLTFAYEAKKGEHRGVLWVSVEDTGIGMAQDQLKKVFEPFYQVEQSLQRRFSGTGLGLSITQRLITLMGGNIEVSSLHGEGTRFDFWLPVEVVELVPSATVSELEQAQAPASGSLVNVPEDVHQDLKVRLERLLQQKSMHRIQQYADLLIQKGQAHPESGLQTIGSELIDAASQFDIGSINQILEHLQHALESEPG